MLYCSILGFIVSWIVIAYNKDFKDNDVRLGLPSELFGEACTIRSNDDISNVDGFVGFSLYLLFVRENALLFYSLVVNCF